MPHAQAIRWANIATGFGFVVIQLDVSVVNLALPMIGADFHSRIDALQWLVDSYAMTFAACLLSAGALGDRWGNRRIFLLGLGIFALTSVACALAPRAGSLIGARVLQGIGAALVLPTSLALVSHACGRDQAARARAIGWWSAMGALAMAAGPALGGLLINSFGWRSIFLVNAPLCAISSWLTLIRVEESPIAESRRFDPLGQCLALVATSCLTFAMIEAGPQGWTSYQVPAGCLIAVLSGAVFLHHETKTPSPMLTLHLFKQRQYLVAVTVGCVISLIFFGLIFVLSLYFERVKAYPPWLSGMAFMPLTAALLPANLVGGAMTVRFGNRLPMAGGMLVAAGGYGLLAATLGCAARHFSWMIPGLLLVACGIGMAAPAMTDAAMAGVQRQQTGMASAILTTFRQLGGVLGVAVFGSLIAGDPDTMAEGMGLALAVSSVLALTTGCSALRWSK